MPTPDLLTTPEVAHALKVSVSTLNRWRSEGSGPPWMRVGVSVRYPAALLAEWTAKKPLST